MVYLKLLYDTTVRQPLSQVQYEHFHPFAGSDVRAVLSSRWCNLIRSISLVTTYALHWSSVGARYPRLPGIRSPRASPVYQTPSGPCDPPHSAGQRPRSNVAFALTRFDL